MSNKIDEYVILQTITGYNNDIGIYTVDRFIEKLKYFKKLDWNNFFRVGKLNDDGMKVTNLKAIDMKMFEMIFMKDGEQLLTIDILNSGELITFKLGKEVIKKYNLMEKNNV